jgi:lambda family phage portal protein
MAGILTRVRQTVAGMIRPASHGRQRGGAFDFPRPDRDGRRPGMGNWSPEVLAAAPPMRRSARHFYGTNAWTSGGVNALVTATVGAGIVPASQHPNRETRRALATIFGRWAKRADADGVTDFFGLMAFAWRAAVVDGEAFLLLLTTPDGFRVRLLPAEMVDESLTTELPNGSRIVAGKEFDASGRCIAFHILRQRPTDLFGTYLPAVRVPAEDVVHLFAPLAAGQVRGISWLAPILLRLSELDQLEDALLVNAKVQAMLMGFLIDQNATGPNPFEGTANGSVLESGLEPGTLKFLPQGWDVKFSTPQQALSAIEFAQLQLRAVAAGLGVPEFLVTGDMRNANYSSLRSALVSFRQRIEQLQYHVIIPQLCQPIYERAITAAIFSGELEAPDFEQNPSAFLDAEWYAPAQPWIDPVKDQQAEALAVANGFRSRRQVVAAQGYAIEDLDEEIAADRERESALGLSFSPDSKAEPNAEKEPADAA